MRVLIGSESSRAIIWTIIFSSIDFHVLIKFLVEFLSSSFKVKFRFADHFHSEIALTLISGRLIRNQEQSVFCLVYNRFISMKFYEDFTTATQNIPYLYFDPIVFWDFPLSPKN